MLEIFTYNACTAYFIVYRIYVQYNLKNVLQAGYMYTKCEGVVNLVENVRTMYWTDWEEMCAQVNRWRIEGRGDRVGVG